MEWRHRFFWLAVTLPWVPYVLTLVAKDDPLLGWAGAQRTLEAGLSSLWQALSSPSNGIDPRNYWRALAGWWASADALVAAVLAALAMSTAVFLLSLPTNNHSWVDKLWSLVPIGYTWHFALHGRLAAPNLLAAAHPRSLIIAALVWVWGVRLTYNFARKGGYGWAAEDYRWAEVRERVPALAFLVFNATFISFAQSTLLLAITLPGYYGGGAGAAPLGRLDAAALGLAVAFLLLEAAADQQQWGFQSAKSARRAAGKRLTGDHARGFLASGLFRYSRHPNFFAEQAFWWSLYLFTVSARGGAWLHWSLGGPAFLSLLFQGSTWLTEAITASKYPKYKEYQATTSCFLPLPPSAPRQTPARRGRAAVAAEPEAKQAPAGEEPAPAAKTPAGAGRGSGAAAEPSSEAKPKASKPKAAAAKAATKAAATEATAPAPVRRSTRSAAGSR